MSRFYNTKSYPFSIVVLTTIMAVDHITGSISGIAKSEKLACIIFCLIDPIFVASRFCSRWTVSQIGADDWMSLVALVGLDANLTAYTITDDFFPVLCTFLQYSNTRW